MRTTKPSLPFGKQTEKKILDRLSAGLSEEEMQRVLAGALSTLGRGGVARLASKLRPDTGAALRRALQPGSEGCQPRPGPAKVLQEWRRAWERWDEIIGEACDEEGKYVIQEHHWEEPCFDPLSVTEDLEPIAARLAALLPQVFDEDLDPDFSFAETVADSVDEIASSLPDWMAPFSSEGFCLGPKATGCLIEWERRSGQRSGESAFQLVDKLRELEAANDGLALDENTLAAFIRRLGKDAKRDVLDGIRAHKDGDRWKEVLNSAHSEWFRIYKDLCRGQDRSGYLETCRARISQDWSLAVPVVKELARRRADDDLLRVCAEAASSFLYFRDGKKWDPRESLMAPREDGPAGGKPDGQFLFLLAAWMRAAAALGRDDTAEALRLQAALLADWRNWDKALAAFHRVSPRFGAMRDKLFEQWRSIVSERSLDRFESEREPFHLWEKPRTGQSWVSALADAARQGEAGAAGFQGSVRLLLREAETSRDSLRRGLNEAARLSLDVGGGDWLSALSRTLARILGYGWTLDKALLASRRVWLSRLGAAALVPELQAFWKRNILRLVPDPASDAGSDYERCVDWLCALREIDAAAAGRLLGEWGAVHWRRKSLWRVVRKKGLPVPALRGRRK